MNTRKVGAAYEEKACRFLEDAGIKILKRNYRIRCGEIDIIFEDGDVTVFAEVKYRKSRECGGAYFAISDEKQKKIRRVAESYIKMTGRSLDAAYRFDAILIDGDEIIHIKNAW